MIYSKYEELYDASTTFNIEHEYRNEVFTDFDSMIGTPSEIYAESDRLEEILELKRDEIQKESQKRLNIVILDFYNELFTEYGLPNGINEIVHAKILANIQYSYKCKDYDGLINYFSFDDHEHEYIRLSKLIKEAKELL